MTRAVASADFRLLYSPLSSVVDLAGGQPIPISSASGREDHIYKLHADGQTNLSITTAITSTGTAHLQVVNPVGGMVDYFGSVGNAQARQFVLQGAGDYYVFVGGSLSNTSALQGSVTATLWNNQNIDAGVIAADQPVDFSGALVAPGQTVTTNFTIAQGASWVLESRDSFPNAQWQQVGPGGTVISTRAMSATQGENALPQYLAAGDYQLKVSSSGVGAGVFGLRATPAAVATAIAPGTPAVLSGLAFGESALFMTDSLPLDVFTFALSASAAGQYNFLAFDA